MKKHLATLAVLALGTLSSFGSQTHAGYQNQFHVPQPTKQAKASLQKRTAQEAKKPAAAKGSRPGKAESATRSVYATAHDSSSVTLGFVSATQIPAGGYAYGQPGQMGDFNGDGKKDLLTIVENYVGGISAVVARGHNSGNVISLSAVLGNGNGTFKPAALTDIGNQDPILVGDVNGDGKDDVVQAHASASPSTVDVWLSNGDGTFTQGQSYQVSPAALNGGVLADVNGDGKLDMLAIDNQTPGLVRTLLGNGDGTFQAATSITLPSNGPSNVIFADFNGDGKVDFAGTDTNGRVNIYLQAGGNFVPTGGELSNANDVYDICALTAGDLNGDGAAELVTADCGDETVTVYPNNGDGTFATTGGSYAVAASGGSDPANLYPYAVVVADINGDGKNDVVATHYYGGNVTILTGNGDNTLNTPDVGYAVGGYYTYLPALVADFNGDGLADIVQIDDNYSYAYMQGYGDGTFRAAVTYFGNLSEGDWPEDTSVASGDFNGDGNVDFAVGNYDGDVGVTIFLSRGDGSLQHGVNYGSGGGMFKVAVADFNGDGKLDVAGADYYNGMLQIYNGVGDGTFTVGSSYSTGSGNAYPYGLVVGDFNHDQHPDIAVANEDGPNVGILLNDGTGGFLTVTNYSMAHNVYEIAAGDMNGDGYLDLLLPLYNSNSVALLLGNTDNSGTFQAESDIALVNGNATYYDPFGIKVADLNGDGNLDFATTAYGSQGIVVALGKGDGTFNTPNLYSVTNQDFAAFLSPSPIGVDAADINGDGKVDLVYSNSSFSTVGVLFGNGDGTFGTPHEYPTGNDPYFFALGDVNGDGAVDVVAPSYIVHEVTVLLNANGSGVQSSFTVGITTPTATVTAGSPATYDMALTGNNGYNGTVTFSCSGLPAHAACSFAPSSIVASGAAQSVAITITTTAATASLTQPALPNSKPAAPSLWASLGGLGIFGLVLAAETKKRNRRNMAIVLGILLVVMSFALVGCGSSSSSGPSGSAGTPAGTYTVVVTATGTGNAPAHSMNLTLTVQ